MILNMAKRKFQRRIYQKTKSLSSRISDFRKKKGLFFVLKTLFYGVLIAFLISLIVFFYYAKDLPRPEKFTERQMALPTKIYDRTGQHLLYTIFGEEKREIVPLEEIPDFLKQAVITAEDANFYHHFGIDIKGILRAILVNLKLKSPAQGGSTIPQQLVRSTFLTPEKTAQRKIREIILTLELDRRYSKNQILEWYLNQVPFGSNTYGVGSASQTFFGKKVNDLSLAEAVFMASLIKAPSHLSPYGPNKQDLLQRKDYILQRMFELGYINQEQYIQAKNQELKFTKQIAAIEAPHFIIYVKKILTEKYGEEFLQRAGLKVYTSLDLELQRLAEKVIEEGAARNKGLGVYNDALVAIDPKTGDILALVGSADYSAEPYPNGCIVAKDCVFEPEFDVATLGLRQPGSAFKPFVYATAFKKGYSDKYIVVDEQTNFGIWGGKPYIPQNYDGRFRGPVTLRQALAQSLNVPSVKVLVYLAGIKDSIETAQELGITTLKDYSYYGPSLVLGGGEVKLLDMTSAFGVFANDGIKNSPRAILKIEDDQGNIIEKQEINPRRVLSSEIAGLISDILSDNEARAPMFGPNSVLNIKGVSVKTGTTQYFNDAWTVGYNSQISIGVWAGNNDNSSSYTPGVGVAAPIWNEFITKAINN